MKGNPALPVQLSQHISFQRKLPELFKRLLNPDNSRSQHAKRNESKVLAEPLMSHLAQEICNYLEIPLGDVLVTSFPDNESFVRYNENIRGADVFLVQSTSSPANHNVMELLIMIDAAKRASAARVTVVLPFLAMSKTGRINESPSLLSW